MKMALTVAGSDPTGGAGLQADLRTFKAMGVHGLSVPSVLTAQNTKGVSGIQEIPSEFFTEQLDTLLEDVRPDALKTGMLYSPEIVSIIAEKMRVYSLRNLVIDPVTVSSTGVLLVQEGTLDAIKNVLFPYARVITPNIYEASVLTGLRVEDENGMKEAALKLRDHGVETVIITGGHMEKKALDLFFDGEDFLFLENDKLEAEFHGTGCVFSSVITACLALDCDPREAFAKAKNFVWNAMKSGVSAGTGMKILNF
ncbi:MAG: bifunctional hydroxymethylpyrimidine kinase/phosphomethylpyrimidine kinase [Nitrospiraceae bacterium]|nr:MAG: bifunctional hydroxymethylpyrimidine kinase/phosphomethylpyrimidine kinase [Nitrospiraceae bacterium]